MSYMVYNDLSFQVKQASRRGFFFHRSCTFTIVFGVFLFVVVGTEDFLLVLLLIEMCGVSPMKRLCLVSRFDRSDYRLRRKRLRRCGRVYFAERMLGSAEIAVVFEGRGVGKKSS